MSTELFGMPGSGKSTYLEALGGTGDIRAGQGKGGIRSALKKALMLTPYAVKKRRSLGRLIPLTEKKSIFSDYTLKEYANRLVLLSAVYHHSRRPVFMDEGIVHRIITLILNYELTADLLCPLTALFEDALSGVDVIYLDVPVNECLRRIHFRARKECALDMTGDDALVEYLQRYKELADLWKKDHSCTVITNCDRMVNENSR